MSIQVSEVAKVVTNTHLCVQFNTQIEGLLLEIKLWVLAISEDIVLA